MDPIKLQIIDEAGNKLINTSIPYSIGFSVKEILEAAFVSNQTSAANDPFLYTVEYYGYSENPQYPGYLGYEIESIGLSKPTMKDNDNQHYWELSIDGKPSSAGSDTTYPAPGSTVTWTYTAIGAPAASVPARTKVVQGRRAARLDRV